MRRSPQKFIAYCLISAMLWSCSKDDSGGEPEESGVELEVVMSNMEADKASRILDDMIDLVAVQEAVGAKASASENKVVLPACLTVTTQFKTSGVTKVFDFGDGCEMPGGILVSGIARLAYEESSVAGQVLIEMTFENFTLNNASVEGVKSGVWIAEGINGFPVTEIVTDIVLTWPEGFNVNVTGDTRREWVSGYGSSTWTDNAFSITGKRYFETSLETQYEISTVEPLLHQLSCDYLVAGSLKYVNGELELGLDYGEGDCDNLATLTLPSGKSTKIRL